MAALSACSVRHLQVAALLTCTLLVLATSTVNGRKSPSSPASASSSPFSLRDVYKACASYSGNCNGSAGCVAAIAKYREKVYQVPDYCDCANVIGYQLVEEYPTINPAVTYISNCLPGCIYGEDCPYVGELISVMSNGGASRAAVDQRAANLSAVGLVKLKFESKEVCFNLTSADLTANVTNPGLEVSIKKGSPNVAGQLVLRLSTATAGVLAGCVKVRDFQVAKDIAYAPHEYYLEVRMKRATAGYLRGTLGTSAVVMAAVSSSPCSVSPRSRAAAPKPTTGFVSLVTDTFRLCYKLGGVANNTEKGASVKGGEMCGRNASSSHVVVPLFGDSTGIVPAMSGCGTPPKSTILSLLADPSSFFASVNVSSGSAASSAVGNLKGRFTTKVSLTATLEYANVVVPVGVKKGEGKKVEKTKVDLVVGEGYACFSFTSSRTFQEVTTAYLRKGKRGMMADVLAMLIHGEEPPSKTGCVWLDNEIIGDIALDPSSYYVSMNTAELPYGAGRGQLQYA